MPKINSFGGLNNVDDASTLILGYKGFMELNSAINVDLSDIRKVSRRSGYSEVFSGNVSCLWSNGKYCFFVQDNNLLRLFEDGTTEVILSNIQDTAYYTELFEYVLISVNKNTYKFDGVLTLITEPFPTRIGIAHSDGPLVAGRYRFKVSLKDSEGREFSLTPYEAIIDTSTPSQFNISLNTNTLDQLVYMTTVNSDEFYYVGTVEAGNSALNISQITEYVPLDILDTEPLGDCKGLINFNGRIYFFEDNFVYFSEMYNPLLVKKATNFYMFPENVTAIIAVDTGIFVSADKTYFIQGLDPSEASMVEVDPFSIIPGTALNTTYVEVKDVDTSGTQAIWRTEEGVNLGTNAGNIYKLTRDKVASPEYSSGAALLRREAGKTQYLTSLAKKGSDVAKFSTTDTISAEIRRNGITIQ